LKKINLKIKTKKSTQIKIHVGLKFATCYIKKALDRTITLMLESWNVLEKIEHNPYY